MLVDNPRILAYLPQVFTTFKNKPLEISKFYCTSLNVALEKKKDENISSDTLNRFRYKYPEFLPDPEVKWRNPIREKLERRDMLRRRNNLQIPEFYVGTIMAVTSSNKHAPGKTTRFVGICIMRKCCGLRSQFLLRNVINNQGVEVLYHLYSPLIQKIEILRLEKRLDDELFYLRDAPNEYSTFSFNMKAEYLEKQEVPINTIKVKLNPKPWLQRYERMDLKGVILPELPEKFYKRAKELAKPWEEYDLMDHYRKTIPEEEQKEVYSEIADLLKELEIKQKEEFKKKIFTRPTKQKLF